ncbi:MAG: hypothetical protein IKJ77_03675 [Firmicutes bacterium]|nr:hypothetical protein [Bacillota bacterium]
MNRMGKKGSYLVEASIIMPLFILAVLMLISAVPALSAAENTAFSVCDELRLESAKAPFAPEKQTMKLRMKSRTAAENPKASVLRFTSCKYSYRKHGIDDLITVDYHFYYDGNDFYGLFKSTTFTNRMTVRAFSGTLHRQAPEGRPAEEDRTVYIFPQWGMRYHRKSCTYVTGSCQMVYLTAAIQKQYKSCKLCQAQSAQIGSPVYCFDKYGEAYHVAGCSIIKRYYVTRGQHKAESQGYTPCSKCGG